MPQVIVPRYERKSAVDTHSIRGLLSHENCYGWCNEEKIYSCFRTLDIPMILTAIGDFISPR